MAYVVVVNGRSKPHVLYTKYAQLFRAFYTDVRSRGVQLRCGGMTAHCCTACAPRLGREHIRAVVQMLPCVWWCCYANGDCSCDCSLWMERVLRVGWHRSCGDTARIEASYLALSRRPGTGSHLERQHTTMYCELS